MLSVAWNFYSMAVYQGTELYPSFFSLCQISKRVIESLNPDSCLPLQEGFQSAWRAQWYFLFFGNKYTFFELAVVSGGVL